MRGISRLLVSLVFISMFLMNIPNVSANGVSLETKQKDIKSSNHEKKILDEGKRTPIKSTGPPNQLAQKVQERMETPKFKSYMDGNYYEEEPNDSFDLADQISLATMVFGSIDDYSNADAFDHDYYWLEVDKSGLLELGGLSETNQLTDGLFFDLYDQYGKYIATSQNYIDDDGLQFQYFGVNVNPGYYFVVVWSTYSFDNYVNDRYAFDLELSNTDDSINEPITRLSGGGRYETAVAISKNGWDSSDYAVIATGLNFPDALSATPLAKKYDAPLLLTDKYTLNESVRKELERLGVKRVFLVGGSSVLSGVLEKKINDLGMKTTRINGQHRYETAVNIAKYIGTNGEIVVATGENFADALSMAPIAAKLEMPIVLVQKDIVPPVVTQYLNKNHLDKTFVVGGTGVINKNVAEAFPSHERISGSDRYQTNSRIIDKFKGSIDFSKLYIATGKNFPDALAGSALAAKDSAALLLTDFTPSTYTKSIINSQYDLINEYVILGGETVVPLNTIAQLFY